MSSAARRLAAALPWLLLGVLGLALPAHGSQAYPFVVDIERVADSHRIVGRNSGPTPVSARVFLVDQRNLASAQTWPQSVVIPAHDILEIGQVHGAERQAGYSFGTRVAWMPGDFRAEPDLQALYRLPFADGETFHIGQAQGGPIVTHGGAESRFAVDIPMPEGTPVVAAREGVVMDTEAIQSEGGQTQDMLTKANSVRILHSDGSIATYAHLAYGSVFVYRGQQVAVGQEIGRSGSTGYSSGPHLHFVVQKLVASEQGFEAESIPFLFYIGQPPQSFEPRYGQRVSADYSSQGHAPRPQESIRPPSTPLAGVVHGAPAGTGLLAAFGVLSGKQWAGLLLALLTIKWLLALLRPAPKARRR